MFQMVFIIFYHMIEVRITGGRSTLTSLGKDIVKNADLPSLPLYFILVVVKAQGLLLDRSDIPLFTGWTRVGQLI